MLSVELHIAAALRIAIELADKHIPYFCPHMHARLMDFYSSGATYEYWMHCDFIVIEKLCNCMIMAPDYLNSAGAKREKALAVTLGHPIFDTSDQFFDWYNSLDD